MKKNLIFLFYLSGTLIVLLLNQSCAPIKQSVQTPEVPRLELEKPLLSKWNYSNYKDIPSKYYGSILFYNSTEIVLEGSFFDREVFVENGVVYKIDSIYDVLKTVLAETPGGFIDLKSDKNMINVMHISFSKNEATYNFSFHRSTDGNYVLNGKSEIIFQGKKFPVLASSIGGACILLFNMDEKKVRQTIKEVAPGWQLENSPEVTY